MSIVFNIITWCLIIAFVIYMRHIIKQGVANEFMKLLKASVPKTTPVLLTLHPEVLGAWSRFLQNPERWHVGKHIMEEAGSLKIWVGNTIENREFYAHSLTAYNEGYWSIEKVKTVNDQLTYYDRLLLDLLRKKVTEYQTKMEEAIADSE